MTQEDTTRVTFLAPEQSWNEAQDKSEHGEMSERFRAEIDRVAHGAEVAEENRLTDRLQTLREDRRDLRREREQIEDEIEETNRDIERIESRLDELREQEGEYDGVLAMLEADLQDGVRIMEGTDKVKRAAQIGDCEPREVIQDLKDRNPDVPDRAYRPSHSDESPNWKGDEEPTLSFEVDSE